MARTTKRNGKIAIWVSPVKEDCLFMPGDYCVGEISINPTREEILKVVQYAYELGRKHQLNGIANYINGL